MQELPDLTASIKYYITDDASREALTAAWKSWIEEAGERSWHSQMLTMVTHAGHTTTHPPHAPTCDAHADPNARCAPTLAATLSSVQHPTTLPHRVVLMQFPFGHAHRPTPSMTRPGTPEPPAELLVRCSR